MSRFDRYVVEARNDDGTLDFDCPQPPVRDWTEDDLADYVFARHPDAILTGLNILTWMQNVHPHWRTRLKTW